VSIDFHEHAMTRMMVEDRDMPWFLYLLMQGSLSKGWRAQDGGASGTLKACDCTEGRDQIAQVTM